MPGLLKPRAGAMPPSEEAPQRGLSRQSAPMTEEDGEGDLGEGEEESNVSPEEQDAYDQFVTNGMKLMHNEKTMPQLLKSVEGGGNPVAGLGHALAMLVLYLEDSAQKSGNEISDDVKFHGAKELEEQLAELAEEAGIHDFDEKELESAFFIGLDTYRETKQKQGTLDTTQAKQDMATIQQADRQGAIDQVLPGLSQYAKDAPRPEQLQEALSAQGGGNAPQQ